MASVSMEVAAGVGLAATPTPWQMERPTSGFVLWRRADGSGGWANAQVIRVLPTMIEVIVFADGYHLPRPMSGVRHVDDPGLKAMKSNNEGGVWDFTPAEKELRRLGAAVAYQMVLINELAADVEALKAGRKPPPRRREDDDGTAP